MKKILIFIICILSLCLIGCEKSINLPDLVGKTLDEAKEELKGLEITTTYVLSNEVGQDCVIGYDGANVGDKVTEGATIKLNLAKNPVSYNEMVYHVEEVASMLGPDSINGEWLAEMGAYGADLGMPVKIGDQIMYLFGDTFSGDNRTGLWNSNFATLSTDFDFSDGITFDSAVSKNGTMIKAVAQGKHNDNDEFDKETEVTKIPTGGIQIGDYVYVFYMSVRYWGTAKGWLITYNQCIKSKIDDLINWEDVESLRWNDEEAYNFGQIYPFKDPKSDYIYLYCIPGGRTESCCLARTKEAYFESRDEIEYLVSEGTWVKGDAGLASLKENPYYIAEGAIGEPCVCYNPYLDKYMLTFTSTRNGKSAVYMLLSDSPDQKFTGDIVLFDNNVFWYYGAFLIPDMMEDNGKTFYIVASRWATYRTYVAKVILK